VPVFAILTLMVPVTALYGLVNPLLTASGRTRLVSLFAWANAATIVAAAVLAAPFGLTALAWALAGRGVLALGLIMTALRLGLRQSVLPLLRLLALPAAGLIAGRAAAALALRAMPGAALLPQLLVAAGVAGAVFAVIVLAAAPRRVSALVVRLYGALLGAERG
jgi:hypothetical protein